MNFHQLIPFVDLLRFALLRIMDRAKDLHLISALVCVNYKQNLSQNYMINTGHTLNRSSLLLSIHTDRVEIDYTDKSRSGKLQDVLKQTLTAQRKWVRKQLERLNILISHILVFYTEFYKI